MKRVLRRVQGSLRQGRHHRAFRIPPPRWSPAQQSLLRRLVQDSPQQDAIASLPADHGTPSTVSLDTAQLAGVATYLWRARKRLDAPGDPVRKGVRQAGIHVDTALSRLDNAGLVVQDHDGAPFHSGMSLEVLAFEDDPTLNEESGEYVKETLRPSVYFRDRRVQMGQVIVRRPPDPPATQPENPRSAPSEHLRENDDA